MSKIPFCNHSPHGWWIASFIIRATIDEKPAKSDLARCTAWENTIILQAADREAAYEKAVRLGQEDAGEPYKNPVGETVRWIYEGLTSLLPIYNELEDGAEVIWSNHSGRSIRAIRRMVRPKERLETFDDTPTDVDRVDA